MLEFELYVPLHDNEGRVLDRRKIAGLKRQLTARFGGFTHFPQEGQGEWQTGGYIFRDRIIILRVLAADDEQVWEWFRKLKVRLAGAFGQESMLITCHETRAV